MVKLDKATRRKQILETSLEIIRQGGIQRLTIKEISRRIGISEQAIYRHFENKLEILTSIIQFFNQSLQNSFVPPEKSESALVQLKQLTISHMKFFDEHPAMAVVIFGEEIFQNETSLAQDVKDALNKRIDHLAGLIKQGQEAGDIKKEYPAEHLAYMFLGTLRLLATTWRLSGFSFCLAEKGKLLIDDLVDLIKTP